METKVSLENSLFIIDVDMILDGGELDFED